MKDHSTLLRRRRRKKKGKKIINKGTFFLLSSLQKWREAPGDPSHMAGTHTNAARYTLPIFLIIDTRNCSTGHSLSIAYTCAYQKLLTDVYVWIMPRTKKKAAVELDDRNVATLALLGLRQMNGQAANKKQKGRATPQRSKRVSPVARRQRKPKVIKTPQKKRPSPSARQQRKKKRADMLTTSSATKKTTKTPKTAKSKRKVRVGLALRTKRKYQRIKPRSHQSTM